MKIILYLSHKDGSLKSREANIGGALKSGFEKHGDTVEIIPTHEFVRPDWGSHLAVVIGIKGRSKRIFEEYRRGGRSSMLVDKSYIGRTEYLRLSIGGFQPPYAHTSPRQHDRWEQIRDEFRIDVRPKRSANGSYLIYAGSSQKYCDWHGLGDVSEFASSVCRLINKTTHAGINLLYRPKPSWVAGHADDVKLVDGTEFSGPDVKLGALLPDCHALVTHGSNAAVEAVIAGVPVVVVSTGACAAQQVADLDVANVLDPRFPDDAARLQWLADLAYCQFNLAEIKNGTAWETLWPNTCKGTLLSYAIMDEGEGVIAQYRAMHQSEKMFRGMSVKGHTEAISDLVAKHKPESMLDYGSGKGRQYDELNLHERWGGLRPTCYDPGYEPLAKKPDGKFDGVICTDVAEHIPEGNVAAFLADVVGYANKFAFFCIFTEAARKYLPDGRNVPRTVRPAARWIAQICAATNGEVAGEFMIRKPLPGNASEDFKHTVVHTASGVDVVVTFRGGD